MERKRGGHMYSTTEDGWGAVRVGGKAANDRGERTECEYVVGGEVMHESFCGLMGWLSY